MDGVTVHSRWNYWEISQNLHTVDGVTENEVKTLGPFLSMFDALLVERNVGTIFYDFFRI